MEINDLYICIYAYYSLFVEGETYTYTLFLQDIRKKLSEFLILMNQKRQLMFVFDFKK